MADGKERRYFNPLDLPEETLGSACRITMSGRHRLMAEYHRGLLGYEEDRVEIATGEGTVRILGQMLMLDRMDTECIVVTGRIAGVEYA